MSRGHGTKGAALAVMCAVALGTAACGGDGGGNDKDDIRAVLEQGLIKPESAEEHCDAFTQRALDDDSDAKGEGAREACIVEAEGDLTATGGFPERIDISSIKVDGDTATAEVVLTEEDGEDDSGTVDLRKEDGDWKIDGSEDLDVL